ncbi:hypothetical protein KNSL1_001373 [Colletotrichum chrysophilum]|nr:hypothetical protein KNSL1_001373 [Colletotrichum chrysophilum]
MPLSFAAVAQATWDGKFSYPPGIEPLGLTGSADFSVKTFGPISAPPADCISVWHPPHPDVYIDDCDSDKEHGWHWVHPGKPKWGKPGHGKCDKDGNNCGDKGGDKCDKDGKCGGDKGGDKTKDHDKPQKTETPPQPTDTPDEPEQPEPTTTPQWKWTTSTITQTAVHTVISCAPEVTNCPGNGGTAYKTVTVPAVVTICPVPVNPAPAPSAPPAAPPAAPTTAVEQPAPSAPAPPATLSSVVIPPVSAPPAAPPAATTTKPADVGTVTKPNPTATTSRAVVTAAAAPNAQRAGGMVLAAVAAAAAFI